MHLIDIQHGTAACVCAGWCAFCICAFVYLFICPFVHLHLRLHVWWFPTLVTTFTISRFTFGDVMPGRLPTQLGQLTQLRSVRVRGNRLTGLQQRQCRDEYQVLCQMPNGNANANANANANVQLQTQIIYTIPIPIPMTMLEQMSS